MTTPAVHPGSIVVLDFGGQYAHLIARRVREAGAYSAILPPHTPASVLKDAAGIILSGGPQSVYDPGSPQADPAILALGIPVLGLCYGLHWITQTLGGKVSSGKVKEYGRTTISIKDGGGAILKDCGGSCTVWMSHGDEAAQLPPGFSIIASSSDCAHAAFSDEARRIYALQFHPEVVHSEHGIDMLRRFVALCDHAEWSVDDFPEHVGSQVRAEVGDRKVFMLVSGGVDSAVAFTLLNRVLGQERVVGLFVDTGLMRKNEVDGIRTSLKRLGYDNLHVEDASEEFFANLRDVYDPEEKRKVIGDTFLAVQERVSARMGLTRSEGWLLGQGTIYPDTIETGGTQHADHIKTHHNRVDAIQKLIEEGHVIEPLKELYKDEVRRLGEDLGLPHDLVWRHPFPGPGLGVRILCAEEGSDEVESGKYELKRMQEDRIAVPHSILPIRSVGVQGDGRTHRHAVALFSEEPCRITQEHRRLATSIPNAIHSLNRVLLCTSHREPAAFTVSPGYITRERADLLRAADQIIHDEMVAAGLYERIWQFPVVLLPVGIMAGGPASAEATVSKQSIVLRPVESQEAMTADASVIPEDVVERMTEKLLALPGIEAVFYDLTSKPPGTIEWE